VLRFFLIGFPGAPDDFFCEAGVNDDADFTPATFFAWPGGNGLLFTTTVFVQHANATMTSTNRTHFFISDIRAKEARMVGSFELM
jgi:hypothetical protein